MLRAHAEMANALIATVKGHFVIDASPVDAVPSFVVFLDEVNTSSILGSVQDVMMDNSLEGEPLPRNIFWVCATNPHRNRPVAAAAGAGGSSDARGADSASGDVGYRDHYQVRPVPEAMSQVTHKPLFQFIFVAVKCLFLLVIGDLELRVPD